MERIIEVPLFPLQMVLFPTAVVPLHIFEQRYRLMIARCLEEKSPFGIVLKRPESRHLQEVPYSVGTLAEIQEIERLEDGRYHLIAVGTERFRIRQIKRQQAYLEGLVESYRDMHEPASLVRPYAERALDLFSSYLEILLEARSRQEIKALLPSDPEELSYLIAYLLDMQDEQKQHLLELTSTRQRLAEENEILRREVPFAQQVLRRNAHLQTHPDRSFLN
ncbi:LON peptidase substrate-binding domain-containing protein [Thermogemmatispora sp.]|uniref:LON peptidase substrate-binding domain-containing protein n=1 Tax=Thermogemmatispora sp. TaxID=1968838 RepID=UPI001DB97420|nr:LON peptidase substrate-binding domain-containing protein [Thermogemmatispora sp.]MBX5451354.1 LON peptidase substrate-binding domain-containing protein [Thermogemmatispora sp.]